MCGIVGYCGKLNATDVILNGLEKLEYRGYDSAGISVITQDNMITIKRAGRLKNLSSAIAERPFTGNVGIGHTRWATHGIPNEVNAHPHLNNDESISVIHNGIIENFVELKEELLNKGYTFKSDTDTEIVAQLLDYYYDGNLLNAVVRTIKRLEGSYALVIISKNNPNELIAVRNESPLVLGIAKDGYIVTSDIPSILEYTRDVVYLDNGEIIYANLNKGYKIYNTNLDEINKKISTIEWNLEAASKEGFEHFMIKEIFEQPKAIEEAIRRKLKNDTINISDSSFSKEELEKFNKIYIVACGTAYHAGQIGKFAIEKFAKLPVITDIASEFKFNSNFVDEKTLIIFVSQSGETADTLSALREGKKHGAKTLAITNVVGSSIAREADKVLYCYAGPEISVASTKAYTTQLIALYFLALDFAKKLETMNENKILEIISELKSIPNKINIILQNTTIFENIAENIKNSKSIFYTGRGIDYITSKEGALKLKEISYIHTEAFPAGELKHGSIALIEEGTNVFTVATQSNLIEKTASNIQELAARGAKVYSIALEGNTLLEKNSNAVIYIPPTIDILTPLLTVIPEQLIAYYTSVSKGNDVDKPRNLAKSVTVE
ncbi:glutamine--fructose-6-phosphate transaminase (isomerizing) [Peptoniphilus sp. oral taxon 386]|uniref:glutamine--fructose-6-phosphate transaminase (isomerizing) n=1 Tax=Peptoniphilus sp. oral taxon 386 TaxID=652713 RepID=UPI0001DA9B58|nr:glutamine--fructose-6-phosphate transaminase (isomerizing) [Peptoniphilus sp. oral taxon 386]EFI42337.1 glutamine-fructose-6-phosphate transaminase (isomerizing) [Peptoniphilus sp. oral taxon 386 str. F0131]